jgi:hypothetical protein
LNLAQLPGKTRQFDYPKIAFEHRLVSPHRQLEFLSACGVLQIIDNSPKTGSVMPLAFSLGSRSNPYKDCAKMFGPIHTF